MEMEYHVFKGTTLFQRGGDRWLPAGCTTAVVRCRWRPKACAGGAAAVKAVAPAADLASAFGPSSLVSASQLNSNSFDTPPTRIVPNGRTWCSEGKKQGPFKM